MIIIAHVQVIDKKHYIIIDKEFARGLSLDARTHWKLHRHIICLWEIEVHPQPAAVWLQAT